MRLLALAQMPRVAPHTGAWIETAQGEADKRALWEVAPHTGAWIETFLGCSGLRLARVAPHTGAWIETTVDYGLDSKVPVAPHTGAWIETDFLATIRDGVAGRPSHRGVD